MKLRQLTKQIITMVLTAAMATTMLLTPSNVSAASKNAQKKANRAYAQAIKKNKVAKFTSYSLIEVTGGGTKELITKYDNHKASKKARQLNIYTYSKGKVKKIWSTSYKALSYNKKQKTIVNLRESSDDEGNSYEIVDAYKYNGKKIVKKATYSYRYMAHLEDNNGNHYTYAQLDSDDFNIDSNIKLHKVIDKVTYTKTVKGKTTKITKKAYKDATRDDVRVWAYTETTKKALIKKLSK